MPRDNFYRVAELSFGIHFSESPVNDERLIPSFEPFRAEASEGQLLFHLLVDDTTRPYPKDKRTRIRKFDTGSGNTLVDKLDSGGYQFIIRDIHNADCCLLLTDQDFTHCQCALNGNLPMRRYGLNNALMLIYAFAASHHSTLMLHASLVRQNDYGYAFIAKSGTGKSTHVSLWLKYLKGCDLMNDDNPIVRLIDGKPFIFGSPWSGKTPCYRNVKAPLGAITRIDRAESNSIDKLSPVEAFASILPACSSMKWDEPIYNAICSTISKIVETTGIYILHCLPDKEAAIVCNKAISKKHNHNNASIPQEAAIKVTRTKSNSSLVDETVKLLSEGHSVTLPLRGISMRPFLEDGRDKALLKQVDHYEVGDAVLAEIAPHKYVLHRIIKMENDNITLRGDGNYGVEKCKLNDIKGLALGFYRKGRKILERTDSKKWRIYSFLWTRLFPIRRNLLFIYKQTLKH